MERDFPVLISADSLQSKAAELGKQITADMDGQPLVVISVLKGAFVFTADLIRHIDLPLEMEFLVAASYEGTRSSGQVTMTHQLDKLNVDSHYLIVEDIIDTGTTMEKLLEEMKDRGFHKVKVCSLLSKPDCHSMAIDYIGFEIGNEFVVGYGLDYNQLYRNLPYIGLYQS